MNYVKLNSMKELPEEVKTPLIDHKPKDTPTFTWSLDLYCAIKFNDSIYYTYKCIWIDDIKQTKPSSIRLVYLMEAIIENGVVTKNRYGKMD